MLGYIILSVLSNKKCPHLTQKCVVCVCVCVCVCGYPNLATISSLLEPTLGHVTERVQEGAVLFLHQLSKIITSKWYQTCKTLEM